MEIAENKMFCSNCGAADQSPNAYCKRCGEWLADKKSFGARGASKPEERMTVMIVFNGLSALLALFSAIALYATYLNTSEAKWSVYVAGACCLVIAIHQMISMAFALELKLRLKRSHNRAGEAIDSEAGDSVAALANGKTTQFVEAPLVTENTTELLEAVPRVTNQGNSQIPRPKA
jgi:hypothetical protein